MKLIFDGPENVTYLQEPPLTVQPGASFHHATITTPTIRTAAANAVQARHNLQVSMDRREREPTMHLAREAAADELLDRDPLALLIGMLLDQQIPLEKAFAGPLVLTERLGGELDAAQIAHYEPEAFAALCAQPPAIHRFPVAMAARIQSLCRMICDEYGDDAAAVWTGAKDGQDLLKRVAALPGFGKQKAQIFVALLGKQRGISVKGWRQAAGDFGVKGSFKSVADIVDDASLERVRAYKRELKAQAKQAAAAG
jgi:uncharacterized HhH-GPD family protein